MPDNKIQLPTGFKLDNDIKLPSGFTLDSDVVKKKVGGEVSSPSKSQLLLPDFEKGKAFAEKGFLMQAEGTKAPKQVKIEPVEKQGLLLNTVSSLDKAFAKGFSSPVKALGTALQGATKKVMGGTGEGYVSDALIKFGDYLNNAIDELTPQDEEFKGTLTDQVAQAFGQVGSLVLTGGLTGAAGKGAALISQAPKAGAVMTAAKTLGSQLASPTAISAGLSMGQAEFDRAIEAGANDDQAFEAFYKNAATGSVLETIPVMQFFKRFNNSTGGSVANYIKTKGVAGLTGGIEEMTTEVMQQLYANKTAKDIYNINQDILDGVGTSGGIGFGVGFLLNAMGANAKILRKQGREKEADVLENQVKQYEDNIENPKVTSDKKIVTKDIVTQGAEIGTQKAVQSLDRDLANGVITPEQHQEGIIFTEKAAQVADKIPETVTGESRVKSIELLVERNDINQANQNLLQQKQTTDVAYHAGIDEEIKANEERIKKLDAEVYNIAKTPSKEFGGKKYIVDGEEVSQAEFEALQGKPVGTKKIIKPTQEQQFKEISEGNTVTFTYKSETEVPEVFKDRISSTGENTLPDGSVEKIVRVTVPKSLADYELGKTEPAEVEVTEEVKPAKVDLTNAEKMNASQNRYGIVKDGEEAGFIVATNPENNVVKIKGVTVNEELRGKNIAGDAYVKLGESLAKKGVSLESDSFDKMEPSATRVWEKLADKGLAVKGENSYQFKPTEIKETPKQEKKLGKSLISQEPIQGKGVVIATETGLTEQERLDKIAEREKQTKISDKVNTENALVQETKLFYEKNKRQRSSSEGLRKLNELRTRARELGLEIDDASESVVRKKGSRKTKIKYNSKADADSIIDKSGKTIYERRKDVQDVFKILNDNKNFLDFKTDLGVRMSDAQLDATIQDILDGVPSKRANRYLDEVQKAIDNDAFGLKDMGNNALTLEQIMESDRDINKIEKELVGEPMDEKALEDWLNDQYNLTPEEEAIMIDDFENLLNEYEYENETRPEAEVSRVKPATEERVATKAEPTEINKKTTSIESKKEVTLQDIYEALPKSEKLKSKQVEEMVDKNFDSIIKQLEKYKIC
jgi:predicted GNAT family acetyltransferase